MEFFTVNLHYTFKFVFSHGRSSLILSSSFIRQLLSDNWVKLLFLQVSKYNLHRSATSLRINKHTCKQFTEIYLSTDFAPFLFKIIAQIFEKADQIIDYPMSLLGNISRKCKHATSAVKLSKN